MTDNQRLPRVRGLALLACLQLAAAAPAFAHKGHLASPSPSPSVSPSAATPVLGPPSALPLPAPTPAAAEVAKKPFAIDWRAAAFHHVHNKIIHFPIALGVAAAILILVTPRWPHFDATSQVLLLAAALFGIAAYFTGDAQLPAFRDTPLHDTGELHEKLGIATVVFLWLGVVLVRVKALKRWRWIYAVLLVLLISATGFVGGVLAHTEY